MRGFPRKIKAHSFWLFKFRSNHIFAGIEFSLTVLKFLQFVSKALAKWFKEERKKVLGIAGKRTLFSLH